MAQNADRLLQAVEYKTVGVEAALPKAIQYGRTLVKRDMAAFEGPA